MQKNEIESEVVEWVKNFRDSLMEFNLEYTSLTESARRWCLQHLPNVVTLRLVDSGRYKAPSPPSDTSIDSRRCPLEELTPRFDFELAAQGGSVCCPKLQYVSFRMAGVTERERASLSLLVVVGGLVSLGHQA